MLFALLKEEHRPPWVDCNVNVAIHNCEATYRRQSRRIKLEKAGMVICTSCLIASRPAGQGRIGLSPPW